MLDIASIEWEETQDLRPTLNRLAARVGQLADQLEHVDELETRTKKDALRWQLLFDTPGIRRKRVGSSVHILQDSFASDGSFVGRKLLAVGSNTIDAVDKALGI